MMLALQAIDGNGKPVEIPALADLFGRLKIVVDNDFRGNYPETWFLAFTSSLGGGAGQVIYTSPDVSMYSSHKIQATAGAFTVEATLDGTTWSAVAFEDQASATSPPGRVATSANTTSIYTVRGQYRQIRVKQSGAVASQVIGSHSVR